MVDNILVFKKKRAKPDSAQVLGSAGDILHFVKYKEDVMQQVMSFGEFCRALENTADVFDSPVECVVKRHRLHVAFQYMLVPVHQAPGHIPPEVYPTFGHN